MEKYITLFTPIAESFGVNIVDIEPIGNEILELGIARKDFEPVDLELCAKVAEALGAAIDYEISLDVGSAGAERLIDPSDYQDVVNQYVHIDFIKPIQDADYVEGSVVEVDENHVTVSYKMKTANKKIVVEIANIKTLRLAVKV